MRLFVGRRVLGRSRRCPRDERAGPPGAPSSREPVCCLPHHDHASRPARCSPRAAPSRTEALFLSGVRGARSSTGVNVAGALPSLPWGDGAHMGPRVQAPGAARQVHQVGVGGWALPTPWPLLSVPSSPRGLLQRKGLFLNRLHSLEWFYVVHDKSEGKAQKLLPGSHAHSLPAVRIPSRGDVCCPRRASGRGLSFLWSDGSGLHRPSSSFPVRRQRKPPGTRAACPTGTVSLSARRPVARAWQEGPRGPQAPTVGLLSCKRAHTVR